MARIEPITGKYIYVTVEGVEYRVYFEENGQGIPLVCQHTAGSSGLQYRHMLNDAEVTSRFRVIALDLPYHGKSVPPESIEWWKEEYKLHKKWFLDFHVEFCKALGLEKPVYIGSSMGGYLAPDLALERPDLYRAVIGCEAAMGPGKEGALAMQPFLNALHHPRINNDFKATTMYGMCGPKSPEKYKRETVFCYSAGAPAVFKGDLTYYMKEHDMNDGSARKIDTSRCAVYLLTGEYDPHCPPIQSQELVEQIKGATFAEMKGVGHFSMAEDYQTMRKYLLPVLDKIAGAK